MTAVGLATIGALVAATLGTPVGATATTSQWQGVAERALDGDTVQVDIAGDGQGVVSVRNAGIQAMESGECHAAAAGAALGQLTNGKKVTLSATAMASNGGRPVRFLQTVGTNVDPQLALLDAGHVLAVNISGERSRGHAYQVAMEKAAARGKNLWDSDACRPGPQQSISRPDMWVKWDLDGSDTNKQGTASENVKIRNTSTTLTLDLSGWYVRGGGHDLPFTFPAGTKVKPRGIVTLFVGKGTRTTTSFFWNRPPGSFGNPSSQTDNHFGALYLMDRDSDIRSHVSWPCVYNCGVTPALKVSRVQFDPPGYDLDNLNGEYIAIQVAGTRSVDLTKVSVLLGGHVFNFGPNQALHPGETLRIHSGKGQNTRLTKYWNYNHQLLANTGGTVRLRTAGAVPITCRAWGSAHC